MTSHDDYSGDPNTNKGDNINKMDNLGAGGDIKQSNEIHQYYHHEKSGTVISDQPSSNLWIDFCKLVSKLPISEIKLMATLLGFGVIGTPSSLLIISPTYGPSADGFQQTLLIIILFVSVLLLVFPIAYLKTDTQARCPNCDERFALRPIEARKTDRTERENGQDIIHGERDIECRNCVFKETQNVKWTPDEFDKMITG